MDYQTSGVCSKTIHIEVEEKEGEKYIKSVKFVGGCHGNTQGISKLVEGMAVKDVIERLEGVRCGAKQTSCPDQLARALKSL